MKNNYDLANIFLGEASVDPKIRGLEAQRDNVKKQVELKQKEIKTLNLKLAELSKQIAEAGGSLIQEDNDFELEMLLSEKKQAEAIYKKLVPKGKIKFYDFDMEGVKAGKARIEFIRKPKHMNFEDPEKLTVTLYFTTDGVEGVENGVAEYFAPYSYFYNQSDIEVKWQSMFEVRYWPASKRPKTKK